MKLRLCCLCVTVAVGALLVVGTAPLGAAEPASVLPVYPGGQVKLELAFTDQDLLPLAKAGAMVFLGMVGGDIPAPLASVLTPDTLSDLLRDLKQVRLVLFTPPERTSATKIREFYEPLQGKQGWHRAVWAQPAEGIEVLGMVPNQGAGLFLLLAGRADSGMPICIVAQTEGMINVLPLLTKLFQAMPQPKAAPPEAAPPKAQE